MDFGEPDEGSSFFRQPPSPDDRLWRHPSELGQSAAPPGVSPLASGLEPGGRRPSRLRSLSVAAATTVVCAGLASAALIVVLTENGTGPVATIATNAIPITSVASASTASSASSVTEVEPISTLAAPAQAWLGIEGRDLDTAGGVMVVGVDTTSPAARGGVAADDVIVALAGRPVPTMADLVNAVRAHSPGQQVEVTVVRNERLLSLHLVLAERPR